MASVVSPFSGFPDYQVFVLEHSAYRESTIRIILEKGEEVMVAIHHSYNDAFSFQAGIFIAAARALDTLIASSRDLVDGSVLWSSNVTYGEKAIRFACIFSSAMSPEMK
jgi:hypothetical protein